MQQQNIYIKTCKNDATSMQYWVELDRK